MSHLCHGLVKTQKKTEFFDASFEGWKFSANKRPSQVSIIGSFVHELTSTEIPRNWKKKTKGVENPPKSGEVWPCDISGGMIFIDIVYIFSKKNSGDSKTIHTR